MSKPVLDDLFSFKEGRRNRKSLIVFMVGQIVLSITFMFLILLINPHLNPDPNEVLQGFIGLVVIAISIPMLVAQFAVMTQRCRDLDKPGYFVILTFVPFISIIFQIYMAVAPGTTGENRYGPDPLSQK